MKRMGLFKTVSLLLGCLTMFSCVDYDDIQPFTGKTLPRKSGYSTGVTNDWIYFNLRTGESFNTYTVNKDIKEGEQINRTDWDLAFCGYTMRTNSGTSGIGQAVPPTWAMAVTMTGRAFHNCLPTWNGSLTRTTCASPCRRTTGTITLWKTIWTSMPTRGSTPTTVLPRPRPMPTRCCRRP